MSETPHGAGPSGTTPLNRPLPQRQRMVRCRPKRRSRSRQCAGQIPAAIDCAWRGRGRHCCGAVLGLATIWRMFNTISTDDAYVNGHVTFVAARVSGQVVNVLVDNNNRVRKGDILVQLDKEPFQIQVDLQQAIVETAKVNVLVAEDEVRAEVAQARANRFKLEHTIEDVNNQMPALKANVAA